MADVVVDRRGFAESIRARLNYLTRLAQARGTALGVMEASPLAFQELLAWADGLAGAGVALAPVSSVVQRAGGARAEAVASGADTPAASPSPAPAPAPAPAQDNTHAEGGSADHG
jgi:hypothetical protein